MKREPGFHEKAGGWAQAVLAGDRGAIARAISQVERGERQPGRRWPRRWPRTWAARMCWA